MKYFVLMLMVFCCSAMCAEDEIRHAEINALFQAVDHKPAFEKYERLKARVSAIDAGVRQCEARKFAGLAKEYVVCMLIGPAGNVLESQVQPADQYGKCLNEENKSRAYPPQNIQEQLPICHGVVTKI